jgi:hypothetical protein
VPNQLGPLGDFTLFRLGIEDVALDKSVLYLRAPFEIDEVPAVRVKDLDEAYNILTARGFQFSSPPSEVDGGRAAMLVDNQGDRLLVLEPK